MARVAISVICGDVLTYDADVLALKFAQRLYGVDAKAVQVLELHTSGITRDLPSIGGHLLVDSSQILPARKTLFVGVLPLGRFDYGAIRTFAHDVLATLRIAAPDTRHVAMTLHGRGFGLDEDEAFRAQLAGLIDAINTAVHPARLESISIVEIQEQIAARLGLLLESILPSGDVEIVSHRRLGVPVPPEALWDVGVKSTSKPHIFVAMPFAAEFDDRFHYGVRNAVNAAGYLCERADLASFTGDVIAWVRERISGAALVVADLSTANPNVYLEIGYAWGRDVKTVLIASSASDLRFDVRGQRCLVFDSIRHLEELLTKELLALR